MGPWSTSQGRALFIEFFMDILMQEDKMSEGFSLDPGTISLGMGENSDISGGWGSIHLRNLYRNLLYNKSVPYTNFIKN